MLNTKGFTTLGESKKQEKLIERIEYYERTLQRKTTLLKPLHEKRDKMEELAANEYIQMMVLEAEKRQLEEIISDLKYIGE